MSVVFAPGPAARATEGPATGTGIGGRVLVLNATYEPIHVCSVRRAAVLLLKAKAEMLETGDRVLHSERIQLDRPVVIRLVTYVRIPRDVHRRKITRKAVLARDAWTCQYCGSERSGLTVDHVIPRSRGGESVWENIVASCAPCNRRKGNRSPARSTCTRRRRRGHPARTSSSASRHRSHRRSGSATWPPRQQPPDPLRQRLRT